MTDPVVTIYNQIVTLLQAEPSLYDPTGATRGIIKPGNFISFAGTQPYRQKPVNRNDGDFPELMLDEGAYADSAYTKWMTFGSVRQGGTNWREQITQIFVVTLTLPDMRLEPCSQLRNAVALALRKGGPRLGLPDLVTSWGPLAGSPPAPKSDLSTSDRLRRSLAITIPVNLIFNGFDINT